MRRILARLRVRRMMGVAAIAATSLVVLASGIRKLSTAVESYRRWAASREEAEVQDRPARDRAIAIAARKYQEIHGKPPPTARTVGPGQVAHVIARREADRRGYLVRFGYQYVVNNERDPSGGPIPFRSGLTVLESFRVGEDGSCEYVGMVESGAY